MARLLLALGSGLLFGAGLAVSGMVDPARVHAFLDLFGGHWDPTLAFVMTGGLLPMAVAWRIRHGMQRPVLAPAFELPGVAPVDTRLVVGAGVFGIGWGIAGLCPGPAIADLAVRPAEAGIFVAAMLAGFALHWAAFDRAAGISPDSHNAGTATP